MEQCRNIIDLYSSENLFRAFNCFSMIGLIFRKYPFFANSPARLTSFLEIYVLLN